jgi:hypothetical protein
MLHVCLTEMREPPTPRCGADIDENLHLSAVQQGHELVGLERPVTHGKKER